MSERSSELRIAPNLTLPLDAVTETFALLGIRGSGKTNTAVVMAEELLEQGQQLLIIDPTNVWWGLQSSADGKGEGYPVVVLGGKRGDLALDAVAGAAIADFVVDNPVSVICSLRHFEHKSDQRRFVTDLCRRLYFRKGDEEHQRPLMVMIDEASLFVPQRIMGEEAHMVGAIQQLVRQGRSSGFGVTLIDQRASTVNKDVLTQLEVLVCHRTSAPQDQKALDEWVRQHDAEDRRDAFMESLASLPQGTAWFWSPGWLDLFKKVKVRYRRTFDSSRTPKAGEKAIVPTERAPIDLEGLKAKLATTIERAKDDDPVELKKRIRSLEAEAKKRGNGGASAADVARAITETDERWQRAIGDYHYRIGEALDAGVRQIVASFRAIEPPAYGAPVAAGFVAHEPDVITVGDDVSVRVHHARKVERSERVPREDTGALAPAQQLMLDGILFYEAHGSDPVTKAELGIYAGAPLTISTFRMHFGRLKKLGLVEDLGSAAALTAAGRAQAQRTSWPTSRDEYHDRMLARVSADAQKRMLDLLLGVYPKSISKRDLGDRAGSPFDVSTFRMHFGRLKKLGLAQDLREDARAAAELFPAGLR